MQKRKSNLKIFLDKEWDVNEVNGRIRMFFGNFNRNNFREMWKWGIQGGQLFNVIQRLSGVSYALLQITNSQGVCLPYGERSDEREASRPSCLFLLEILHRVYFVVPLTPCHAVVKRLFSSRLQI